MFEDDKVYGDTWIEAMVNLPNNVTEDDSYVIRIQAYVGNSAYSEFCGWKFVWVAKILWSYSLRTCVVAYSFAKDSLL